MMTESWPWPTDDYGKGHVGEYKLTSAAGPVTSALPTPTLYKVIFCRLWQWSWWLAFIWRWKHWSWWLELKWQRWCWWGLEVEVVGKNYSDDLTRLLGLVSDQWSPPWRVQQICLMSICSHITVSLGISCHRTPLIWNPLIWNNWLLISICFC